MFLHIKFILSFGSVVKSQSELKLKLGVFAVQTFIAFMKNESVCKQYE